ncbi:lipopolysaccharide heptosyltransferase II [Alkalilimnicola sp. S0819]|nr:lipopolysaccharide heptosyltransferase II [Alkalilimnicola sp. S0819]MPQ16038.1 lipopolysaccharide heptosyltransferase II [Alkalilimnicola sp. S0819]
MVMAQSLFMRLRETQPQAVIDVLAPGWTEPLLARMPQVNQALTMPLGHGQLQLGLRRRLGRELRARAYTDALVLPNSLKSALVPYWAGIRRRVGYRGEARYGLLTEPRALDKQRLQRTVERFVALAEPADAPQPPRIDAPRLVVEADGVAAARARLALESEAPVLALCPGAEYGPAKRWPVGYFAELARAHLARGWQVWIFGSHKDREVSAQIDRLSGGRCADLAGETSLAEAIDLMSVASAVVSNDSGLMHVAAALQRPLVALYGSSDPGFTPPLNDEARILRRGLSCSPCFKRECPLGHLRCLREITPEQVLAQLPR